MAVTLSATLFSTTLPPKRNTNCASTRVISNLNISILLPNLNSCKRLIKFSPRQSHVVASAVSGSPLPAKTESSLNSEDAACLLETVKVFDLNGMEFRFRICGKIGQLSSHLRAISDAYFAANGLTILHQRREKHSLSKQSSKEAGLRIRELYMEGYQQDWKLSFEQDTVARGGWQQGGILVAGPGKSNILYIHKDKEAGDDPDIKDILKACCGM